MAEPAHARIDPVAFAWLAVQVGLVLAAAVLFKIELERGFATVAALVFGGFLVHAWLPLRLRVPFFVLLTMVALGLLLGVDAVWLVALGLGLVGLCHLPLPWGARVGLIVVAAAALAVVRTGRIVAPWGGDVLTILAAMFMFRIILYLYDLKTDRTPASPWQRVAYFFLLPNVSFPLFPVVDYKTFLRTYYDAPAAEIYQKGVTWMLRGVSHLLLYRLIYYLLPIVDTDLSGILGVYVFMAMTFMLYLRVSGLFHLIVGSLSLFGFNLPRTNHYYFLASSFTDLWRRINIYWKDFMMTIVFYPVFMRFRQWSLTARLVVATAIVFVVTWLLHSYQWFWLQGVFPLRKTDIAFWGFLGVALSINSVREARRGRQRRLGRPPWSWKAALSVTLSTLGVFSAMSVLWTLWSTGSFSEWWHRLLRARESTGADWLAFAALIAGAIAAGIGFQWLGSRGWGLEWWERTVVRRAPVLVPSAALALVLLGTPSVSKSIGGPLATGIEKARSTNPNRIDRERLERGYYETLSRSTTLAVTGGEKDDLPEDWVGFRDSEASREVSDLRGWEIVPNVTMEFRRKSFRSNQWGLRDREYELKKPPGTYRVAVLGSSYVMGSGVANDETFENVVENRLNQELSGRPYDRYEILNFGVAGHGMLQAVYIAERVVGDFEPDLVIYVVHPGDVGRMVDRLQWVLERDVDLGEGNDYIRRILEEAETRPDLPLTEFARRIHPHRLDLMRWGYVRMVASIRSHGAVPAFTFLPSTGGTLRRSDLGELIELAREAGAVTLSVGDVYEGYDMDELVVAEWDNHPNALGHRLIARGLYAAMLENADAIRLSGPVSTRETGE